MLHNQQSIRLCSSRVHETSLRRFGCLWPQILHYQDLAIEIRLSHVRKRVREMPVADGFCLVPRQCSRFAATMVRASANPKGLYCALLAEAKTMHAVDFFAQEIVPARRSPCHRKLESWVEILRSGTLVVLRPTCLGADSQGTL